MVFFSNTVINNDNYNFRCISFKNTRDLFTCCKLVTEQFKHHNIVYKDEYIFILQITKIIYFLKKVLLIYTFKKQHTKQ